MLPRPKREEIDFKQNFAPETEEHFVKSTAVCCVTRHSWLHGQLSNFVPQHSEQTICGRRKKGRPVLGGVRHVDGAYVTHPDRPSLHTCRTYSRPNPSWDELAAHTRCRQDLDCRHRHTPRLDEVTRNEPVTRTDRVVRCPSTRQCALACISTLRLC